MSASKKTFVAGHNGLVGSAICKELEFSSGEFSIVKKERRELDITNREQVRHFFKNERPEWVFLCAAKVGGIHGNNTYPADFLLENLKIQNNVLEAAKDFNTEKLLFLGSSCIYPKECPQPIKEEYLLSSKLEPTNEAYAIAKISGLKLVSSMNKQFGTNFISVMPSNLYGPNDNYHPEDGHALPMLLRRFHEAKANLEPSVKVWGTGKPRREFLYSQDLAKACLYIMKNFNAEDIGEVINIGTGQDVTISELAEIISEVVGYEGTIEYDLSKPDGTFRKLLDIDRLSKLGWKAQTSLKEGLVETYRDFVSNPNIRKG